MTDDARREIAKQFKQYYPGLLNALIRRAGTRALAEDMIGDAIVKLLEHADAARLSDFRNVAGYIFQVSRRLLANHERKMDNKASLREGPQVLEQLVQPEPGQEVAIEEICAELQTVLTSLPTRDHAILKALYLDKQDRTQVCAEFDLTPTQLNKILSRARKRLQELIRRGCSENHELLR